MIWVPIAGTAVMVVIAVAVAVTSKGGRPRK